MRSLPILQRVFLPKYGMLIIASLLLAVFINVYAASTVQSAQVVPCTKYGYKISKNTSATIYRIDPNNPTPEVFLNNIPLETSAFAYSSQYGYFYATSLNDDAAGHLARHLYMIDGAGAITAVDTGGELLDRIGMGSRLV